MGRAERHRERNDRKMREEGFRKEDSTLLEFYADYPISR